MDKQQSMKKWSVGDLTVGIKEGLWRPFNIFILKLEEWIGFSLAKTRIKIFLPEEGACVKCLHPVLKDMVELG